MTTDDKKPMTATEWLEYFDGEFDLEFTPPAPEDLDGLAEIVRQDGGLQELPALALLDEIGSYRVVLADTRKTHANAIARKVEQPMPTQHPNAEPIFPEVERLISGAWGWSRSDRDDLLAVMAARRAKGIATYGTELHTHNGRSMSLDALEEAADLLVYAVGLRVQTWEGRSPIPLTLEDKDRVQMAAMLLALAEGEMSKLVKLGPKQ